MDDQEVSVDFCPVDADFSLGPTNSSHTSNPCHGLYMPPMEYTWSASEEAEVRCARWCGVTSCSSSWPHPASGCFAACVQHVLICGWGEHIFMGDLLREFDHGPAALPPGSEITLFNEHSAEDTLGDPALWSNFVWSFGHPTTER